MSTITDVVELVEKWPEPQRNELLARLLKINSSMEPEPTKPYVTCPLPLGIRSDKLPSDLLAEIEDEEFLKTDRKK